MLDAAKLLEGGALLLDVREEVEWVTVRAPGATHIPMRQLSLDQIPSSRTIACICHLGVRSASVADALVAAGYDAVNVAGGMDAWEAAGLPVKHG